MWAQPVVLGDDGCVRLAVAIFPRHRDDLMRLRVLDTARTDAHN